MERRRRGVLSRSTEGFGNQAPLLRAVARRVSDLILGEVQPQELGLQAYFNFRSESEQAERKEEVWV